MSVNKSLVRHLYANALDSTARLTAYSLAQKIVDAEEEVAERSRQLAVEDLILLSISLRRLVEAMDLGSRAKNMWICTLRFDVDEIVVRPKRAEQVSLWALTNLLVHVRLLDVVDSHLALAVWLASKPMEVLIQRSGEHPRWLDPICFAKSDRNAIPFQLSEFALRAAEFLAVVREVSSTNGLFLDSDFLE